MALLIIAVGSAAEAQRGLSSVRGGAGSVHSNFVAHSGLRGRIHSQDFGRSGALDGCHPPRQAFFPGVFPEFLPDFDTSGTQPGETQGAPNQAAVIQAHDQFLEQERYVEREAEGPLPPQTIEIPSATPINMKPLAATIFILSDGETLETQRYILTTSSLWVTVHREQKRIPVQMLDIDATLEANRNRGVDLQIPSDNNEVWLRF